jgi:hypothetical protein
LGVSLEVVLAGGSDPNSATAREQQYRRIRGFSNHC